MGVLRDDFWGFGCPNDTQKPLWLGLWLEIKEYLTIVKVLKQFQTSKIAKKGLFGYIKETLSQI